MTSAIRTEQGSAVMNIDGAYFPLLGKAGVGVYIKKDSPWNVSEPIRENCPDNNMAECHALVRGIEVARAIAPTMHWKIYSDSEFLYDAVKNGVFPWPASVPEHVCQELEWRVKQALQFLDFNVCLASGHSQNEENKCADTLAKEGALNAR